MRQLTLEPISKVSGEVHLPGSKSLSNRALLLAALAKGTTRLTNLLDSDDVQHMLAALKKLGVEYRLDKNNTVCEIKGMGGAFNAKTEETLSLFLGNAGTVMRPLTAVLCLSKCLGKGKYILTGEARMKERPIGHLVDALREVGAKITYLEKEHFPPLCIESAFLKGGSVEIDGGISSQFLTAFLMVAPLFDGDTEILIKGDLVSKPYIDMTLHMMSKFGVEVSHDHYRSFKVKGNQTYKANASFLVEGDASSASYFLAAGAIKGGEIKVTGIGRNSVQGDIQFADALALMGAEIEWGEDFIIARPGTFIGVDMDFNHIPDAAMTIAVAALFAQGPTRIRNVYNWRVKETDRLTAMATELRKVGATVLEGEDDLLITPPQKWEHAQIKTYDDHRMAMCFSLVALSETAVTILDPQCTSKTFPDYFNVFNGISIRSLS